MPFDLFIRVELDQVTCSRWLCSTYNQDEYVGILYLMKIEKYGVGLKKVNSRDLNSLHLN
jgi:hypothetical protein